MNGHSAVLRGKIDLLLPSIFAVAQRLWSSPALTDLYPRYLCMLHGAVRAIMPLMELALGRCQTLSDTDPVARSMVTYLHKHMREERGHDEWLCEDLAAIGHGPDKALRALPGPAVVNLVESQYYWINHYHPVCLLSHILVLEGYPPSHELVGVLIERAGYPRSGFRTLERHAVLDVRHRDVLMRTLDELPLSLELQSALDVSALHTVGSTSIAIEEVLASDTDGRRSFIESSIMEAVG
jgi:hypothetical protein